MLNCSSKKYFVIKGSEIDTRDISVSRNVHHHLAARHHKFTQVQILAYLEFSLSIKYLIELVS